MKKLHSVLTDDLHHCIITGDCNIAIHHVFNGPNRPYQRNTVFWSRCVQIGTIWLLTVCIWIRSLMSH